MRSRKLSVTPRGDRGESLLKVTRYTGSTWTFKEPQNNLETLCFGMKARILGTLGVPIMSSKS